MENTRLRALMDEAQLSSVSLARAVVAAGARQGVHLGTSATSVKRMLQGCQPRWPVPRVVATVLSRRLQREVTPVECGFADRSPATADFQDGSVSWAEPGGTMRCVTELAGRDINRRNLLLGSMFVAAAFAEPTMLALTVPPSLATAKSAGQRIGLADVEAISSTVDHFRRLGNRLGGGLVREQVVRFLHGEANRALHGSFTEPTGRALFSAVAQATRLAGSMAKEVGRPALGQRYYVQAFNLAMHGGDRLYAAETSAHMARLAVQVSQGATTRNDSVHNARHAVALVRTARSIVGTSIPPTLSTQLHAVEARGLAQLGDTHATTAAVDAAMRSFDSARPEDEPPWLGYYTRTELYGELGQGLRDVGCVNRATGLLETALGDLQPWRVRSRAFTQTDLAMTYLAQGEIEGALTATHEALRIAESVASQRVLDRIRVLRHRLAPHLRLPGVADTDEQIAGLLASPGSGSQ